MSYDVTKLENAFYAMLERYENGNVNDYFPPMRENSKLKADSKVTADTMSAAAGVDINRYCHNVSVLAANVLAFVTCNEKCHGKCDQSCYAIKNELCHGGNVDKNYCIRAHAMSTVNALFRTKEYFDHIRKDIQKAVKRNNQRGAETFIRIHAAGDFINRTVFNGWIEIVKEFENIHFLAFTKQYDLIASIDPATIPDNLALVISLWPGLEYPKQLLDFYPVSIMHDKTNTNDVNALNAIKCPGNCGSCKLCWYLQAAKKCTNENGLFSAVYFNKH